MTPTFKTLDLDELKARNRLPTSFGSTSKQANYAEEEEEEDEDDEDIGPTIGDKLDQDDDQDQEDEDLIGPSIDFNQKNSEVLSPQPSELIFSTPYHNHSNLGHKQFDANKP